MKGGCATKRNKNRLFTIHMMKRKGGVPPIVTVLVTIAAIVAAGLVAYFLYTSTAAATKQPVLEVSPLYVTGGTPTTTSTGAAVSCGAAPTACRLSITIQNVGSVTLSSVSVQVWLPGASSATSLSSVTGATTLAPGQSLTFGTTLTTGTIPDAQGVTVEVRYAVGTINYVVTLATKTAIP